MSLKQIAEPAIEPVTLAEAKLWCRVTDTADDDRITLLIADARQRIERRLERSLITQTWEQVLDTFPADGIDVPLWFPPVTELVSIKYLDTAGVEQTWSLGSTVLDSETLPGWVRPAAGLVWPSTIDSANAVRIRFKAGYGLTAADVPETIRSRLLQLVVLAYEHREPPDEFWCALEPFQVY